MKNGMGELMRECCARSVAVMFEDAAPRLLVEQDDGFALPLGKGASSCHVAG
jgi:hypothetical protein